MAKMKQTTTIFFIVVLELFVSIRISSAESVNVALRKKATALYTCGVFGTETYNTLTDANTDDSNGPLRTCVDARDPGPGRPDLTANPPSFPATNMVDGDTDTWWQSTSRARTFSYGTELNDEMHDELEALITLDLEQEFLVESVTIQLGDALTPQRLCIEKSLDGSTYDPWVFAVSNIEWCDSEFGVGTNTVPTALNGTICVFYAADDDPPGDTITISFTGVSTSLVEWTRARFFKIKFYDMLYVSPFNVLTNTYNHYAVSELTVMAECPCNGQQTGCEISETTGMYECICGGNTRGRYCELCLPLYNQYKFQFDVPCEQCNCFNHADSCFYEEAVELAGESLDINGQVAGGGVCIDCQHNTDGNNCEKCAAMNYRPSGVLQTAEDACQPCLCIAAGSTLNPDTNRVDCVINDDVTRSDGKVPGDCFCKENVEGSKCDTCKAEFYNLQQSNADGCSPCNCYTPGTVGASEICTPDAVGQCPCKANVQGRRCEQCKDGFYGLSGDDVNGCTPCECDVGGAVNQVCDKATGQCMCRSNNIVGRTCNSVKDQFYFPGPHSISTEIEDGFGELDWDRDEQNVGFSGDGYVTVMTGDSISFLVDTPVGTTLSGRYSVIFYYSGSIGGSLNVSVAGQTMAALGVSLPACSQLWCISSSPETEVVELVPGPNLISIDILSDGLLLDEFVAFPVEYWNPTAVLATDLPAGCDLLNNLRPSDPDLQATCDALTFSLTMYYWSSPLPCECDLTGSTQPACETNGGQCDCRPGVVERTCSKCSPDHYNFGSTGCAECNCDAYSTTCDPISGQCECPDNTFGRQCEYCLPDHWDWDLTDGCQECTCDPIGSISLQCNATTGLCSCKTGVEGDNCDVCKDGYHSLGSTGCLPCSCDLSGSENDVCNKTSAQCPCKANVEGLLCNTCINGTFGLGTSAELGCQDCICMGVTTQCSAGSTKYTTQLYALSSRSGSGEAVSTIELTNRDGSPSSLPVQVTTDLPTALVTEATGAQQRVYWKMPDSFTNNLVALYGTDLTFTVTYIITDGSAYTAHEVLLISDTYTEVLTYPIGTVLQGVAVTVTVSIRETAGWQLDTTDASVSRDEFLKYLATTTAILTPASFSTGDFTARLSAITFSVENAAGTANAAAEDCACGAEYSGGSCELCTDGYKRINVDTSDYFGECSLCDCNGHSDLCDPDTAVCLNCQHDTTGDACESCKVGYYGNATLGTPTDCTPCPCYLPRVINATCTENTTSGAVTCDFCQEGYVGDFCDSCDSLYYGNPASLGGTCSPCDCNGNADTCDSVTGVCDSCGFNTTGDYCESCAVGFYGDASQQNCQECACQPETSSSTTCDAQTGQCPCVSGVNGRDCSYCLLGYWGFDNAAITGCQACGCVEAGSTSVQCDNSTGICSCNPNTSGNLCDTCDDGYYGLPTLPCQECGCDVTGTVPGAQCDKITGQCECQPGVGGRQCDQCLLFYVNFTTEGCDKCGECQESLGGDIDELSTSALAVLATADIVKGVQEQDERLQNLTVQLNASLVALGIANSDASSATEIVSNLTATKDVLVADDDVLQTRANALVTATSTLESDSQTEYNRHEEMSEKANNLTRDCNDFEDILTIYAQVATSYSSQAAQYVPDGSETSSSTLNFDAELAEAQAVLDRVQDTTSFDATRATVDSQSQELVTLNNTVTSLFESLDDQDSSITDLDSTVTEIVADQALSDIDLQQAQEYESQAADLVEAVEIILNTTEILNTNATANLSEARVAVTDATSVLSGDARNVMDGEDDIAFPTGVINYQTAVASLTDDIASLPVLIEVAEPMVIESEAGVIALANALQQLNASFSNIPGVATDAVLAIQNFEEVITDLDNSVIMAEEANELLNDIRTNVSGDALATRSQEYNDEKAAAESLRTEMDNKSYQPTALQTSIQNANDRLDTEPAMWASVDMILDQMTETANGLNTKVQESTLDVQLAGAVTEVATANSTIRLVAASVNNQEELLIQEEEELNRTEDNIAQIQALEVSLTNGLSAYQTRLNSLESSINTATTSADSSDSIADQIEAKILLLESKLADAESLLAQTRQPVKFDGTLGLEFSNPQPGEDHLYDEVSLEVRKPETTTDGLIFFVDDPDTEDQLQVGLKSDKVFFQYSTGSTPVVIESPAEICPDCWVRVDATRYGLVGHLTVTALSNGGSVSTSSSDTDVTSTIALDSSIYIGTLDEEIQTTKVESRTFVGCLHNVEYQGEELNLWTAAIATSTTASCCQRPPELPGPNIIPGNSFSGLSYLVLPAPQLISQVSTLQLDFRSFSADVTLFRIQSSDNTKYFTIKIMDDGDISWEIFEGVFVRRTQVQGTFNTGDWVEVSTTITATSMSLAVKFASDTNGPVVSEISFEGIDITDLDNQNFILGADSNPLVDGYTPSDNNFAGCMRNLKLTSLSGEQDISFTENVIDSDGVNPNGCYEKVVSGIRFSSDTAYAQFSPVSGIDQLQSLSFKFITEKTSAILAYVSASGSARFLYLAVFGGNVIVVYRQDTTRSLVSTGQFVSDGQVHTVELGMFTSRVSMMVDGVTFEESSATLSVPYLPFSSSAVVSLGGVSPETNLESDCPECPVKESLVGGFTSTNINGLSNLLTFSNSEGNQDVSLAGIVSPPDSVPAPPVTDDTVPLDTCPAAPAPSLLALDQGFALDGSAAISWTDLAPTDSPVSYFLASFQISFTFTLYKADGVLLYIANSVSSPTNYFTIYFEDSKISVKMRSSLGEDITVSLAADYNTGEQYTLGVSRINDYVALSVDSVTDYANSGKDSSAASSFAFDTTTVHLYLGGLGTNDVATSPLPQQLKEVDGTNFAGAIYSVQITAEPNTGTTITFPINVLDRSIAPAVPQSIRYGLSLSGEGTTSYLGLGTVTTTGSLSIDISITTSSSSGVIFLLYQSSPISFLAVDVLDNQLRLHLPASYAGLTEPMMLILDEQADICDSQPHTLQLTIDVDRVTTTVDETIASDQAIPVSHGVQPLTSAQLYIAGVPSPAPTGLPEALDTTSLSACVLTVTRESSNVNEVYDPTQYVSTSSGVSYSCAF